MNEKALGSRGRDCSRGEAALQEYAGLSESQKQEHLREEFPDYKQADGERKTSTAIDLIDAKEKTQREIRYGNP